MSECGTRVHSHRILPALVALALASLTAGSADAERAESVAAGGLHTCALTSAGTVLCWGDNGKGQLGTGTNDDSGMPAPVSALGGDVAAVSAGALGDHTCALTSGGGVLCWGDNQYGQLGNGTTTDSNLPVAVSGLGSGVVSLATGSAHSCAFTSGGAALCWGKNDQGQLGDGTTTSSSIPVAVSGLGSGVVAMAAGYRHTCATTAAGAAFCWGEDDDGEVGDGTSGAPSLAPVAVSGLSSGVAGLAVGLDHSCALTDAGSVLCWGDDFYGQLGDGGFGGSAVPVAVSGLPGGVTALAAGSQHTCALTDGDDVLCWGRNDDGQVGEATIRVHRVPVAVADLPGGITRIEAGWVHTCAIAGAGSLWCWGGNQHLQLGDGTATETHVPTAAIGLGSGIAAIAAGFQHTCARDAGGAVLCWGYNILGELGDGTEMNRGVAAPVSGLGDVTHLASGYHHSCVLDGSNALCWGNNIDGQLGGGSTLHSKLPIPVSGLPGSVAELATGLRHSCARTAADGALCWGGNASGQLGDGTTTGSSTPVGVSGLGSGVSELQAGGYHSCAIASGALSCWGDNSHGQLGNGTTTNSSTPVGVSGLGSGVASVAAGLSHTCAVTTGGAVLCWGLNVYGEVGIGTAAVTRVSVPSPVVGLASGVAAVAVGQGHSCALTTGGAVLCWGGNYHGQLGDGTTLTRTTPVAVSGLGSGVAGIAAGGDRTCALTDGGGVLCWGDDQYGQLGIGHSAANPAPLPVVGFSATVPGLAAPALLVLGSALVVAARGAVRPATG
jgi:alpha-tubulin suppressor-like RCC1 family protein